jgi:hypothetical protein
MGSPIVSTMNLSAPELLKLKENETTFFNIHSKDVRLPFFVEDRGIMGCKPFDSFFISHSPEWT